MKWKSKKSESLVKDNTKEEIIKTFPLLEKHIIKRAKLCKLDPQNLNIKIENFNVKLTYKINNLIFELPISKYASNFGVKNYFYRYRIKHFAGNYNEIFKFLNFVESNIESLLKMESSILIKDQKLNLNEPYYFNGNKFNVFFFNNNIFKNSTINLHFSYVLNDKKKEPEFKFCVKKTVKLVEQYEEKIKKQDLTVFSTSCFIFKSDKETKEKFKKIQHRLDNTTFFIEEL